MLNMTLFELINPSDPLTFYAPPNLEVAAVVAYSLSSHYGAVSVDNPEERSPILLVGETGLRKETSMANGWKQTILF